MKIKNIGEVVEVLSKLSVMIIENEKIMPKAFDHASKNWHQRTANAMRSIMDSVLIDVGVLKVEEKVETAKEE